MFLMVDLPIPNSMVVNSLYLVVLKRFLRFFSHFISFHICHTDRITYRSDRNRSENKYNWLFMSLHWKGRGMQTYYTVIMNQRRSVRQSRNLMGENVVHTLINCGVTLRAKNVQCSANEYFLNFLDLIRMERISSPLAEFVKVLCTNQVLITAKAVPTKKVSFFNLIFLFTSNILDLQ